MRCRLLALAVVLVAMSTVQAEESLPPLPPLTNPASNQLLPGKFVWADLFSNDIGASRRFYERLLGWEWRWVSEPPNPYGIFSADGYDVAGLAYRDVEGDDPYARWVHYLSVRDTAATVDRVRDLGGRVLLEKSAPDRGDFAIFSAANEVLLDLITSASGDPEDLQSLEGEWIWRQLYVRNVATALAALKQLAPFDTLVPEGGGIADVLLTSDGYLRGGVAALPGDAEEAPTWIGFVRVADAAALAARAHRLGGREVFVANDGAMAIVADPGGALLGLVEYSYPVAEESE